MEKGKINTVIILANDDCVVRLTCSDGMGVEIKVPDEALKDKTITERFNICIEKAERYLSCLI